MQRISLINKAYKKLSQFIQKEPLFSLLLSLTFIIAFFLRTYKFFDRIYVYADNTIYVQIAYYAFTKNLIPQIGPFAQAPFFTGPWWLWILKIFFLLPFGALSPWFAMYFLSFVSIVLFFYLGQKIQDKWLGLTMAFLATISTAQIDNFFMTWNASADPFLGLMAVIFFVSFLKDKKPLQIFFLAFTISLAFTIHFQTFLLGPLILIALLTTKPKFKNILFLIIGGIIPLLPFLYFDLRYYWFETRRILDFVLIAQYRTYVPNRWLTYAGQYWPSTWSFIIGGNFFIAYVIMILTGLVSLVNFRNFKKYHLYYLTLISFFITIVLFRYYRGEKFFYYTNFAHAFVLVVTGWTIWKIAKFKKWLGILVLLIISIFTLIQSIENFKSRVITYKQANEIITEISEKYPGQYFDIYECPFNGSIVTSAVSYLMYFNHQDSANGIKIGLCNENFKYTWREITDNETNKPNTYMSRSNSKVYIDTVEWWKTSPPQKDELY